MEQPDFFAAFDPHRQFTNGLGSFRCETRQIGELSLPSGRVVVGDPLVDLTAAPLSQRVPPGHYPVVLAIARFHDANGTDERIACAMIRISGERPIRWALAVPEDQDPAELKEGEIFGYGVDSGTGCFASAESAAALTERTATDEDYYGEIARTAEQVYISTRDWASVVPDARTTANVVTFSSGLGDGFYASYWGYDERDQPVCLITDFGIVGPDEEDPPPVEKRPWWKLW